MRYTFIKTNRDTYPITLLCKVMMVSRRGFYNWLTCPSSARTKENQQLIERIRQIFNQKRQVYDAPRIHKTLLELGIDAA